MLNGPDPTLYVINSDLDGVPLSEGYKSAVRAQHYPRIVEFISRE